MSDASILPRRSSVMDANWPSNWEQRSVSTAVESSIRRLVAKISPSIASIRRSESSPEVREISRAAELTYGGATADSGVASRTTEKSLLSTGFESADCPTTGGAKAVTGELI